MLIPALKDAGATDLLELPICKIVDVTTMPGTVVEFDVERGLGRIVVDDGGAPYPFHCTQIADGTRIIAVGAVGDASTCWRKLGRYEATCHLGPMTAELDRAHPRHRADRCGRARWSATATSPTTPASPGAPVPWATSWRRPRTKLPWWRVVNSVGRLVPGNEREQAALLRAEGVTVAQRPGRRRARTADSVGGQRSLDLHEGEADLRQRLSQHRRSAPRRSPRPSTMQAKASMASAASARSRGVADRWIAASSYRPMAWLSTTTWAGTSASRRRASASSASDRRFVRDASSTARPSDARVVAAGARHRVFEVCSPRYPTDRQLRRSGADAPSGTGPHPATRPRAVCARVDARLELWRFSVGVLRLGRGLRHTGIHRGRTCPLRRSEQP